MSFLLDSQHSSQVDPVLGTGGLLDNNFKKVGVVIYAHGFDEVLLILYLIWTLEAITTAV